MSIRVIDTRHGGAGLRAAMPGTALQHELGAYFMRLSDNGSTGLDSFWSGAAMNS